MPTPAKIYFSRKREVTRQIFNCKYQRDSAEFCQQWRIVLQLSALLTVPLTVAVHPASKLL
jgi:hypothetical protein